jgi:hypothetical protein
MILLSKIFSYPRIMPNHQSYEERRNAHLSELGAKVAKSLSDQISKIDSFEFDIFEMDKLVGKKSLRFLSYEIFNRYNFFEEIISEKKYKSFIDNIADGYSRQILYHNDLHAADVLQTMFVMIEKGSLVMVNINHNS